jgi:hypothetical protein
MVGQGVHPGKVHRTGIDKTPTGSDSKRLLRNGQNAASRFAATHDILGGEVGMPQHGKGEYGSL